MEKMNVIQKIISKHLLEGQMGKGEEIGIKIDQTLTQDATGTMAYLQFEALEVPEIKTELSVSYVDHNTLQMGFENSDDHNYLQTVASNFGICYSKAGNGICHQVHLERFAKPGKTLLGSDSHTPTAGGMGSMAIGAGGLDVALAMAGKPFYITFPKVVKIELTGNLKPYVGAKDIILKVLEILTTKGNVGCMVEYAGEALKNLTVPMRATITNMGAELGVTTSVFPSDQITKEFLRKQKRENDWTQLEADPGASYDREIKINLDELEPLVAKPHSPDNIDQLANIEGVKVDQVCIGSCTNSSYDDLMMTAKILEGKKVHQDVSLIVAPGSKQVFKMIADQGALAQLILSGARVAESACGFCIGSGHSPKSGGISLRTNNRNFIGRSGTKDAQIYLVSPIVAAASAIEGKVVNPKNIEIPHIESPSEYSIDDSMIFKGKEKREIIKGPNILNLPRFDELPESIKGQVALKVGDKITTDHIMPAGPRLKFRSNIETYSSFVFEGVDPTLIERSKKLKSEGLASVIVGGESYGQGSSREHAALCPRHLGIRIVLAKTIERIHRQNLINFGILPLFFQDESDYEKISQLDNIELPNIKKILRERGEVLLDNKSKNLQIKLKYDLSDKDIEILLKGGKLNYYRS